MGPRLRGTTSEKLGPERRVRVHLKLFSRRAPRRRPSPPPPIVMVASHACLRHARRRPARSRLRHQFNHAAQRERDEVGDVRPDRHLPLEAAAAKRRSLTSACQSARSASVGLRRKSRDSPRTGARSPARRAAPCSEISSRTSRPAGSSTPRARVPCAPCASPSSAVQRAHVLSASAPCAEELRR